MSLERRALQAIGSIHRTAQTARAVRSVNADGVATYGAGVYGTDAYHRGPAEYGTTRYGEGWYDPRRAPETAARYGRGHYKRDRYE